MFCGARGFKNVDAGDSGSTASRKNASKNPYSARGLDKFSALLAELEERRAKIVACAGAQGKTMIRFTYSSSNDWIPIIINLRDPTPDTVRKTPDTVKKPPTAAVVATGEAKAPPSLPEKEGAQGETKEAAVRERKAAEDGTEREEWNWRKSCCWPLAVLSAMLLCLVVLGKVFAICCTTVGWYMVPVLQGENGGAVKRSFKKKDYMRRLTSLQVNKGRGAQEISTPKATLSMRSCR